MHKIILFFCLLSSLNLSAQEQSEIKWYHLSELRLRGRAPGMTENPFQRFPDSMQANTREPVWKLSRNPAGVNLQFTSTASQFTVRYAVEGELQFPHMPATGVSGVDLYVKGKTADWQWVKGNYHFADTISYTFQISKTEGNAERKFMLYLPLYNSLKWMEIGLDSSEALKVIPTEAPKPIIVYGTSITQGACASRPGNAWSNSLSRNLDIPVLNFDFSGNGRLEPEIIDYLAQLDARAYALDCLANFGSRKGLNAKTAYNRLIKSVLTFRKAHPKTPVLLTDHAGYPGGETYLPKKELYETLNAANHKAFTDLKKQGVKNIYLLSFEELGLTAKNFVDGVHPTDGGMDKYAKAYEGKLRAVFGVEVN